MVNLSLLQLEKNVNDRFAFFYDLLKPFNHVKSGSLNVFSLFLKAVGSACIQKIMQQNLKFIIFIHLLPLMMTSTVLILTVCRTLATNELSENELALH